MTNDSVTVCQFIYITALNCTTPETSRMSFEIAKAGWLHRQSKWYY